MRRTSLTRRMQQIRRLLQIRRTRPVRVLAEAFAFTVVPIVTGLYCAGRSAFWVVGR